MKKLLLLLLLCSCKYSEKGRGLSDAVIIGQSDTIGVTIQGLFCILGINDLRRYSTCGNKGLLTGIAHTFVCCDVPALVIVWCSPYCFGDINPSKTGLAS